MVRFFLRSNNGHPVSLRSSNTLRKAHGSSLRLWLLLIISLLLLTAIGYANAVFHPFVYDSITRVIENPEIRSLSNLPAIIGFESGGFKIRNRWVRNIFYAQEYAAVGPWPPLYHLTNVVLHACVAILVLIFFSKMSGSWILGWWTAALFTVHPIQTEVVAQVAGRRELLAALFSLTTLIVLQRYTQVGGMWRLGAACSTFYLATFSKENGLIAAPAFVIVDVYQRLNTSLETRSVRSFVRECWDLLVRRKFLYSALALLTLGLTTMILFGPEYAIEFKGSPSTYDSLGKPLGILNRLRLIGLGLRMLLVPFGQSVDYSFDALELMSPGWKAIEWLDFCVFIVAVVVTVAGLSRRAWFGLGGLWFFLFNLPHTGIIAWHEIFAERFLYLSSIGVFMAMASAGIALSRTRWYKLTIAGGMVGIMLLTAATIARNEVWGSSLALWQSAVARYPSCARAQKSLADAYMTSKPDLALDHYRKATEILPEYLEGRWGIAAAQTALQQYDAALESLKSINPEEPSSLRLRGYIYQMLGDREKAKEVYQRLLRSNPSPDVYNNLGVLYLQDGDRDAAITMFQKTLLYNQASLQALENLGALYQDSNPEKARLYKAKAKRLRNSLE